MLEAIAARQNSLAGERQARIGALQAERERLSARLTAAKAAHLDAPELFTMADVRQVEAAVRDNVAAIDHELLGEPVEGPGIDVDAIRRFLEGDWLQAADSNPAAFRAMLRQLVDRVEVRGRGDYRLSWQIPTSA